MKKNILLLHGAIGASDQLSALTKELIVANYAVYSFDFQGHGGANPADFSFSIKDFALQTQAFIQQNKLESLSIFGYSMGGYVAAYLAIHGLAKVDAIFTLGSKWNWTPEIAANECKMLNVSKIEEKLPAFAQALSQRHGESYWRLVLEKTAQMLREMGENNPLKPEEYKGIPCPIRLAVGDKDNMVSLEETIASFRSFGENASFCAFPNTAHPIEKVSLKRLLFELESFFV